MSQHLDYFSDMLLPGEQVQASIGGAGSTDADGKTRGRTWVQMALTEQRILVVILNQSALGGSYHPTQRLVADQNQVQILRFPRTAESTARLEVTGMGIPLALLDIDHPDLFPQVGPFVQTWGRPLGGAGTIHAHDLDPYSKPAKADSNMLIITLAVAFGMIMVCCLGSSAILIIQRFVLPQL